MSQQTNNTLTEAKLKLFDEFANEMVAFDNIYALISVMFDEGWTFDLVKEYCLAHFSFEEGEFENECYEYKNSVGAKHPELVTLENYTPKPKEQKPVKDYSTEYEYLNKIIAGTKRSSIGKLDRTFGCLINTIWEDHEIIIKNMMSTPAPESIHTKFSITFSREGISDLHAELTVLKGKDEPNDWASIEWPISADLIKEAMQHNITIYGLQDDWIDKEIETLTNGIERRQKAIDIWNEIKTIMKAGK